MTLRQYVFRVSTAAAGVLLLTPANANAETQLITNCPTITETGGVILAQTATECAPQGDYQYNAAPTEPDFPYPWDDPFYGSALMIGGFAPRPMPAPAPAPMPAPGR
ncbi:MAG: hypothetical protein ACR2JM_15320 [Mycobacterium sp.]